MNEADLVDRQFMSNERDLPDRYFATRKSLNPAMIRSLMEMDLNSQFGRGFSKSSRKSIGRGEFSNKKEDDHETVEEYESNDDAVDTDADENSMTFIGKDSTWQEPKNEKTSFKALRFEGTQQTVNPIDNLLKRSKNSIIDMSKPKSIKETISAFGYEAGSTDENFCNLFLIVMSYFFVIILFPFSLCSCFRVCQEYERAVIFRLGRVISGGAKGPGIFFILPCLDKYSVVDLRTVTFNVPPQEILTKDSVTVSVDAVVYFRIFNSVVSVINVEDAAKSTKLLGATTLRKILGTKSLQEILSDRESIASLLQVSLDEVTVFWGVKVERVEVKDVRLPVQLQRAMATEAEATRESKAKVIAAKSEKKASEALVEAAEILSESPIAVQLRYLQTLTQIASDRNSTILFPLPIEILSFLSNKTQNLKNKHTNQNQ